MDIGIGPKITSTNYADFLRQVFQRLSSNGADRHGWKEWAVDLMCQQRPDMECDDTESSARAMTGDDVWRFLTGMWEAKEEGIQPVSEELQNQRIDTCLACPKLGYISCFTGCGKMAEVLASFTLGRNIRKHPEVHKQSCLQCGCLVEVKTMFPIDILLKMDEKHGTKPEYHASCWILSEAQNIPPNEEDSSPQPAEDA